MGQLLPEVRVGDGNEGSGPLQGTLVAQVRYAVLRHHILDAGAGRGDDAAGARPSARAPAR